MQTALPTKLMRGSVSRGPSFGAENLQADVATLEPLLLAAMVPADRGIDDFGARHPATSKFGAVSCCTKLDAELYFQAEQLQSDQDMPLQLVCCTPGFHETRAASLANLIDAIPIDAKQRRWNAMSVAL